MKVMITDGVEKVKGMAELKKLYNIPAAELSETWIDCKVELDQEKKHKKVEKNIETEKALDKYGNGKLELKTPSDAKIGTVVLSYDTNEGSTSRLQVIDEVKVIKGTFGYYHKSKDGIRFSEGDELLNKDIAYKNKQRAIEDRNKVVKGIDMEIQTLENKLIILRKQKYDSESKFNELEQVFDL